MRTLTLLLVALAWVSTRAAEPELKGTPAELAVYLAGLPKLVVVAGEAELKVTADRANVTLRVTTESKSLGDALRANHEVRGKMLAALRERGVAAERVQSSRFSSTPKHWVFSDKARSYRIENLVKVSVHDDQEFSAVAQLVDKFSEVQFVGIEFEHSDKEGLKKKALAQALDNANERKAVFEQRLGVKLAPRAFSQAGVTLQTPERRRTYEITGSYYVPPVRGERATPLPGYGAAAETVSEETGTLFGELIFTARVSVDYALETRP